MKKSTLTYILFFFSLILLLDFAMGNIFHRNFHKIGFGDYGAINASLKSDADIFILGSSRASHHYDPKIISRKLNKTCRNAGIDGYGVFLSYAILKERIQTQKPELILLDLSPNIIVDKNSYSKLNRLLPYYQQYTSFKEIIELNPEFSKLETISNLYMYNSTLYYFVRNNYSEHADANFGYLPLDGKIDESIFTPFFLQKEDIDNNQIVYIEKIIAMCRSHNIRLIGIISPTYTKFDTHNNIISELQLIFENNALEFYDYSDFSEIYSKSDFFNDQLHMNWKGTEIFSESITQKISHGN